MLNKVTQILKKKLIKPPFGESNTFLKIEMYLPPWEEMEIWESININIQSKDNLKIKLVFISNFRKSIWSHRIC